MEVFRIIHLLDRDRVSFKSKAYFGFVINPSEKSFYNSSDFILLLGKSGKIPPCSNKTLRELKDLINNILLWLLNSVPIRL